MTTSIHLAGYQPAASINTRSLARFGERYLAAMDPGILRALNVEIR